MHKFQFNIPSKYILSPFDKGYYAEVSYEVVYNKVLVISVGIPFEITGVLIMNPNFQADIYAAAENNAISFDLIKMMA